MNNVEVSIEIETSSWAAVNTSLPYKEKSVYINLYCMLSFIYLSSDHKFFDVSYGAFSDFNVFRSALTQVDLIETPSNRQPTLIL